MANAKQKLIIGFFLDEIVGPHIDEKLRVFQEKLAEDASKNKRPSISQSLFNGVLQKGHQCYYNRIPFQADGSDVHSFQDWLNDRTALEKKRGDSLRGDFYQTIDSALFRGRSPHPSALTLWSSDLSARLPYLDPVHAERIIAKHWLDRFCTENKYVLAQYGGKK